MHMNKMANDNISVSGLTADNKNELVVMCFPDAAVSLRRGNSPPTGVCWGTDVLFGPSGSLGQLTHWSEMFSSVVVGINRFYVTVRLDK